MLEDFLSAIKNFQLNKSRTLLSLLGIIIGVTSVVITTSLGSSLEASMKNSFKDLNSSIVTAFPQRRNTTSKAELNDTFRNELKTNVDDIKEVFFINYLQAYATNKNLNAGNKEIRGIEYGWFHAHNMELLYGSDFSLGEYADGVHKVIIGENIARGLFPEGRAVGKLLTLYIPIGEKRTIPASFEVSGVMKNKDTLMGRAADYILVPRAVFTRELGRRGADMMDAELYSPDRVAEGEKKIRQFSDEYTGNANSLEVFSIKTMIDQWQKSLSMVSLVLSGIAAISLLVGGIGIMNIMLVTVAERKQEIGIRKAIGAARRNILSQFLTESATLTLTGAVFGMIFGMFICFALVTKIFPADMGMIFVPSISGGIIAFAVSVFIGIFFGLYPAIQASQLDPVKALEEM